jgi:hypothetical protein
MACGRLWRIVALRRREMLCFDVAPMPAKRGPKSMSDQHKAALAEGRAHGRAIRVYLEALQANKPKRGRKRTPESIKKRLADIERDVSSATGLRRLELAQERIDLSRELSAGEGTVDLGSLEKDFVKAAKSYSERKGISYAAWREVGVPAATLKQAGISRSS